jgi:DNA replication ATP-dependent helicase Dna2
METSEPKKLLVSQLEKIQNHTIWSDFQKNKSLFELQALILEEATKDERINFTTLFSRLAYTGARFQLNAQTLHYAHIFRKAHEQGNIRTENETNYANLGMYVCTRLLHEIFKIPFATSRLLLDESLKSLFQKDKRKTIGFKRVVEAVLFEINDANKTLHFFDDEDPSLEKMAQYDVHDKNEQFNQNIESLKKTFTLPIHINFIDVDIREDGMYIPLGFIIHPDHLVDVTAVSECFKEYGAEPFLYLISKFKPAEASAALMTGNLVNLMLDILISEPDTEFKTILSGMFRSNPLGFAMMDDQSLMQLIAKLKEHYTNLRNTVKYEFKNFNINRDHIFLEPSFFSRDYGIQGRLDLLHQKNDTSVYDIIELKSGKTYKPNVYGINASHYIQTLLYDLMIKSAFEPKTKSFNYILYSKENDKSLRFAPPVKAQQFEAMKLRNDILAIEQKLQKLKEENTILAYIKPENFPKLKGFNIKDVENFLNIYTSLKSYEKTYFDQFTAFIANEHALSKTGEHGVNKSNGHAALWLENDDEKKDRFALLSDLTIAANKSKEEDAFITFARSKHDPSLVNFRIGDIGVLYPSGTNQQKSVLKNQIFKCTITQLTNDIVEVKLRNKQYNQILFDQNNLWNIEQDSLDSGFNSMYKSLFLWAAAPMEYRSLFLGKSAPAIHEDHEEATFSDDVTPTQRHLLNKIIAAKNYFLLWGPPGTGKTSVMLKNMVKYLHDHTRENILLLAYTNRAVDEICDAVISISSDFKDHFIRLGSRVSAGERFESQLLDQKIKKTSTRQDILTLLEEKRIFISTVSSMVNRTELFSLKEFDTVIIDEASQILEPMLCGLLSRFKRYILIGDHKQLPAVVVQDSSKSKINHEDLRNMGINNTRTSLFERLYLQVVAHGWNEAYGILEQQGRMHETLMEFPNQHFYDGKLQLLPGYKRQTTPLFFENGRDNNTYLQLRRVFIHTMEDEAINWKTNMNEAQACVKVMEDLMGLYELNGKTICEDSIGIITPYKAQIALIRKCMEKLPHEITKKITVDTVERYQGGARDIVIISFCVNKLSQLETLVSLSHEGVDRKLNVALTRAKEQIILIGNKELLTANKVYKDLINSYEGLP